MKYPVSDLRDSIRHRRVYKGSLYLVGNGAVAKQNDKKRAKNEYHWGTYLLEHEINVPAFYALVRPDSLILRCFLETPIRKWFIIMQKINGNYIGDLRGATREEAIRQYRREMEHVLELGIYPIDSHITANGNGSNSLFDQDKEILYLIDFEAWRKGQPYEIDELHRRLKSF